MWCQEAVRVSLSDIARVLCYAVGIRWIRKLLIPRIGCRRLAQFSGIGNKNHAVSGVLQLARAKGSFGLVDLVVAVTGAALSYSGGNPSSRRATRRLLESPDNYWTLMEARNGRSPSSQYPGQP